MSNILIVDDDKHLREVIERLLTLRGHQVHSAGNGKGALAVIEQRQIDLVITDILMPDMDGYELIAALRKRSAPPRIIAMSGGSGRLDSEYLLRVARSMKVDKLLEKPLTLAIIDAAISEVLGGASEEKQSGPA
jgi:CheY-like chemotaxis protein